MAIPPVSFRPAQIVRDAISTNGGGRGLSHRLAQISDRYLELIRRADLPKLTEAETNALYDAFRGTLNEPAAAIRGSLWLGIEDSLPDGLAEKWNIDAPALLNKLQNLTFVQEIALIEKIEAYWADAANS